MTSAWRCHIALDVLAHVAALSVVAAAYWDETRSLLDLARPGDRRARYDVLVELGRARPRADDPGGSQGALLDAVAVAEAAGDREAARWAAALAPTPQQTSPYDEVDPPLIGAA